VVKNAGVCDTGVMDAELEIGLWVSMEDPDDDSVGVITFVELVDDGNRFFEGLDPKTDEQGRLLFDVEELFLVVYGVAELGANVGTLLMIFSVSYFDGSV
jgi:hypothetical protein